MRLEAPSTALSRIKVIQLAAAGNLAVDEQRKAFGCYSDRVRAIALPFTRRWHLKSHCGLKDVGEGACHNLTCWFVVVEDVDESIERG